MHQFRFFIPPESIEKKLVKITGADAHHAISVLRLKAGDSVKIFDGVGIEYSAEISSSGTKEIILTSLKEIRREYNTTPAIDLFLALTTGFDDVIQVATELGVSGIYPIFTDRTQLRVPRNAYQKKVERWKRIAISASMQCGRIIIPEISEPIQFADALSNINSGNLNLIASLEKDAKSILSVLTHIEKDFPCISVFIGPPADFSDSELQNARGSGLLPVRLMKNTLRTETAALSALAVISSFFYTRLI